MFSLILLSALVSSTAALVTPPYANYTLKAIDPANSTVDAVIPSSSPGVMGPLNVEIHPSCNSTSVAQIMAGLEDAEELALTARQHLLENGRTDGIFVKYFGENATTAPVIGILDRIVYAHKPGVLMRCDDPDQKCVTNPTWAGYYRGDNADTETVICDKSFLERHRLEQMCTQGYSVANSNKNLFWGSDLIHRLLHVPVVSEDAMSHLSHDYGSALEMARKGEAAHRNTDSLQYFALEVYGTRIAAPGIGCVGEFNAITTASPANTTMVAANITMVAANTTMVAADTASNTTVALPSLRASRECYIHADGSVHCD